MLFPISDDNSDRRSIPAITYILLLANIFVFIFFQGLGSNYRFTNAFSVVPLEIISGQDIKTSKQIIKDPLAGEQLEMPGLQETPVSVYLTLFTSMFMHGGIAHLLGNMWFLWIFGDNVEDRLGKIRYILFYLACGVLAALAHVFSTAKFGGNPLIPCLGASGAISGILAGYLVINPGRRVRVIFFRIITEVPALVAVGSWFLFQLINGI